MYLSTNCYIGSATKFTYQSDMVDENSEEPRYYKLFVAPRSNLAALVEVFETELVRPITIEKIDAATLEMRLSFNATTIAAVKFEGKQVESTLIEAVAAHDTAWPDKNACIFRFVVGNMVIEECFWKKDWKSVLATADSYGDQEAIGSSTGKEKAKGGKQSALSKPKRVMKGAMKKPARK